MTSVPYNYGDVFVCSAKVQKKSALIGKIKGSLCRSMIFAFYVKILMPSHHFEVFCSYVHTKKVCKGLNVENSECSLEF